MVKMKSINKKTFLTITHDFTVLLLSFIFAIWLRLGNDEIIKPLKIEIISWIEAYFHIP